MSNSKGKSISGNKTSIYLLIVFFAFLLYGNTILNNYVLDDEYVITGNRFTQKGIEGLRDIFSYDSFKGYKENIFQVSGGRYRPFSIATFAVEHQLFGNNPHISHFINVLLFSLTCCLIYYILSKLMVKFPADKWYKSLPFIATILFVAHPVHTETVAYIKSRDEIFSFLFSLLSFLFWWKYLDSKKKLFLGYSSILFLTALFSKESAFVFILIFPLTLYFFTDHPLKAIIRSVLPLFIIIILFIILRQIVLSKNETAIIFSGDLRVNSFAEMNFRQKYATIAFTLGMYLKLLFIPHPLTWDYNPYHIPIMEWSDFKALLSLIIYLFLLYFSFNGLGKKKVISWCIFIFLIPLSITSNILFPIGTFMSERFLYVASLGFTTFLAYITSVRPNNLFQKIFARPYLFLGPLLFLYSLKIITRNTAWKDNSTLYETDVKISSNSATSNALFGKDLYDKAERSRDMNEKAGYFELAYQYCDKAFKINPRIKDVNMVLGTICLKFKNDLNKSIYYLSNAVRLDTNDIDSYYNLGFAYATAQQYDNAVAVFEIAIALAPRNDKVLAGYASVCNNIAFGCTDIDRKLKYFDLAFINADKAIKINPDDQLANIVLGLIYVNYKNDLNKSVYYLNNAINLNPGDIESYNNLGNVYLIKKQYDIAIEIFEKALKISPYDISILNNLAFACRMNGNTYKADMYSARIRELQGKKI